MGSSRKLRVRKMKEELLRGRLRRQNKCKPLTLVTLFTTESTFHAHKIDYEFLSIVTLLITMLSMNSYSANWRKLRSDVSSYYRRSASANMHCTTIESLSMNITENIDILCE